MRNLILILFFFIYIINANSRSIEYSKELNAYYQLINKGVLTANDHHYKKSLRYFKKAFKVYPRGFPSHFHYALQICEITNDRDFGYFCAENMLKYGLCIEFFAQFKILEGDSAKWDLFVKKFQTSLSVDTNFAGMIDDLRNRDQGVRWYYHNAMSDTDRDSLHKIRDEKDSLHYIEFKNMVHNYGFPSADLIGLHCFESFKGFYPPQYDVLLWHFSSNNNGQIINIGLDELLSDALNDGNISNLEYARYIDNITGGVSYRIEPFYRIGDIFYILKMNKVALKEVNKKRIEIGLLSYEEQNRLMENSMKTGGKYFNDFFPIIVISSSDFSPAFIERNFEKLN